MFCFEKTIWKFRCIGDRNDPKGIHAQIFQMQLDA